MDNVIFQWPQVVKGLSAEELVSSVSSLSGASGSRSVSTPTNTHITFVSLRLKR